MPRPASAPRSETEPYTSGLPGFTFENVEGGPIEVSDVTAGMFTNMPRKETPPGSAEVIKNGRVRSSWTGRRGGLAEIITKPDSNKIIGLIAFYPREGRPELVRITPTAIQTSHDTAGWQAFTGDVALGDRPPIIRGAEFLGRLYITSRVSGVLELDFPTMESTELEEAPHATFVTNFANRLVVARDINNPAKLWWSGRLDPRTWDPEEDISAGFETLSSSGTGGVGNGITGLFGLAEIMVILRERSIFHVSRQPFARAPFRFTPVVEDQGCDLPNSAVQAGNGIIFADYQSNGVFIYEPGSRPQRISKQIEDQLFDGLINKPKVQGAWDPFTREYHLGLVTSGTEIDKLWVWSADDQAWTFDEGQDFSELGQFVTVGDVTTIDDLGTTLIDNLTGTIDDLGNQLVDRPGIVKGTTTGETLHHDRSQSADWDATAFEFIFQSPNMGGVARRRTLQRLMIHLITELGGDVTMEYSKDGSTWRKTLTKTLSGDPDLQKAGLGNAQLSGDNLYWRVRTTDADIQIFSWWVKMMEKGLTRFS